MKINLENSGDIIAIIAGLFQFKENEQFSQAALAITEDDLFIYDDNAPDQKQGDNYFYKIKKRFKLEDITMAVDEQIVKNRQLNNMGRLVFLTQDEDQTFTFYYFVNDKKDVQGFIKELAAAGIKTKKKKANLKIIKF